MDVIKVVDYQFMMQDFVIVHPASICSLAVLVPILAQLGSYT